MGAKLKISILSGVIAVGWGLFTVPQEASAEPIQVNCPAGASLNDCVAEACQNPDGGQVLLKAGQYDANLQTALNVVNNFPAPLPPGTGLCQGGVSIIGKGANKTILVANGPNPNPIPNAPPLNFTLAIGSANGEIENPVEIRDLTVSCAVPGTCSTFGISVFNAASTTISDVRVQGFSRGILAAGSNFTVRGNYLQGTGIENFGGRGIFAAHPAGALVGRQENLSVTDNVLEDFWRGVVADTYEGVLISGNAFLGLSQGIFAQNIDGELEISENFIYDATVGIFAGLGVFDTDFVGYGNTPDASISKNLILDSQTGVGLSFDPTFEATVTLSKNIILKAESALEFDPNVNPPNLPPPPSEASYDPCLHEITLDHNVFVPLSSRPDLGECQP